jgi:hypothetical protein
MLKSTYARLLFYQPFISELFSPPGVLGGHR